MRRTHPLPSSGSWALCLPSKERAEGLQQRPQAHRPLYFCCFSIIHTATEEQRITAELLPAFSRLTANTQPRTATKLHRRSTVCNHHKHASPLTLQYPRASRVSGSRCSKQEVVVNSKAMTLPNVEVRAVGCYANTPRSQPQVGWPAQIQIIATVCDILLLFPKEPG